MNSFQWVRVLIITVILKVVCFTIVWSFVWKCLSEFDKHKNVWGCLEIVLKYLKLFRDFTRISEPVMKFTKVFKAVERFYQNVGHCYKIWSKCLTPFRNLTKKTSKGLTNDCNLHLIFSLVCWYVFLTLKFGVMTIVYHLSNYIHSQINMRHGWVTFIE